MVEYKRDKAPVQSRSCNQMLDGKPLDYSFRNLTEFAGLMNEAPRSGRTAPDLAEKARKWNQRTEKKKIGVSDKDMAAFFSSAAHYDEHQKETTGGVGGGERPGATGAGEGGARNSTEGRFPTALKLCYNEFSSWQDFPEAVGAIFYGADKGRLRWVDLSFNKLTDVSADALANFASIGILYLHANQISSFAFLEDLSKALPNLKTLTLHDNPIEEMQGYRTKVLAFFPNLKKFDFSSVTKADRDSASIVRRSIKRRQVQLQHHHMHHHHRHR